MMSDQELAEIKKRHARDSSLISVTEGSDAFSAHVDRGALIVELERLRDENMRVLVAARDAIVTMTRAIHSPQRESA